jgi:hypothetical protein
MSDPTSLATVKVIDGAGGLVARAGRWVMGLGVLAISAAACWADRRGPAWPR